MSKEEIKNDLTLENEKLKEQNNQYSDWVVNLSTEINKLKEENLILMRKVLMYQDMEIKQYKEIISNNQ